MKLSSKKLEAAQSNFPVSITPHIAKLIEATGVEGPIARQYLPSEEELNIDPNELSDPIGDEKHSPLEGIVHRYKDRALFKVTQICPVYCRFCFRREMIGPKNGRALSKSQFADALNYLGQHNEIREVIFTGGDPLILSHRRIQELVTELSSISHIRKLRWHTRVPVVAPDSISPGLIAAMTSSSAQTIVAIHANHVLEFTEEAKSAIRQLKQAGFQLLSQTVLLRTINDNSDALSDLFQAFSTLDISPYYLHHTDLAPGTSHFRTTIQHGLELMKEIRKKNAPHPKYVLDLPGGFSKVDLESADARRVSNTQWELRDDQGRWHQYNEQSLKNSE